MVDLTDAQRAWVAANKAARKRRRRKTARLQSELTTEQLTSGKGVGKI
jgi:hypothetical protein